MPNLKIKGKTLLLLILLIILTAGLFISSKFKNIPKNTSINQASNKVVPTVFTDETANWKTYKGTTFKSESIPTTNISFKYPPEWKYKEEYAHATVDLGVFLQTNRVIKPLHLFTPKCLLKSRFMTARVII